MSLAGIVGAALYIAACSPKPDYKDTPVKNEEPAYCYFLGFIDVDGISKIATYVDKRRDPPHKWQQLLCSENYEPPFYVGINIPSKWDNMTLSMDRIIEDVSGYQAQNSGKWQNLEVATRSGLFMGFMLSTYVQPPQPGQSINAVPEYRKLLDDLFGIIERHAEPKSITA